MDSGPIPVVMSTSSLPFSPLLGGVLSLVVGFIGLVIVLAIQFPDRAIFTRKRKDVPLMKGGIPILGNLYQGLEHRGRRLDRELDLIKEYGIVRRITAWPIFRKSVDVIISNHPMDVSHVMSDPYLFVKDAKEDDTFGVLLGDGIFISDGHAWKTSRKIASNLFTIKGFRDFFSKDFVEECDRLSEHLRAAAKKDMFVDLQELLLRCTLDSFVRLALGKDPQCLHGEGTNVDGRYTLPFSKFMKSFDQLVFLCSLRGADPLWNITEHFNGKRKQVLECAEVVNSFAYDVIKEKREVMAKKQEKAGSSKSGEEDRQDLLDHFMASKNDDGSDLSDKQLRDAVMNFTLAGRDTTAQTLSWCFWELAQRPEWEAKLREEAMRVLGPDGPTTFESLKELPLTYAFFNETLRLHANVPGQGRKATQDTVLPGTNIPVYAGDIVAWNSYAMGRLPEVWGPDAAEFKPERWILEGNSVMKQNTKKHYVFNGGPRLCLGINFAQQEAAVFLSTLVRRFHFDLVNEDDPAKWGHWDADPAKRQGRYTESITLGVRGTLDVKVTPLL